jgi:hypothetical protein
LEKEAVRWFGFAKILKVKKWQLNNFQKPTEMKLIINQACKKSKLSEIFGKLMAAHMTFLKVTQGLKMFVKCLAARKINKIYG